MTHATDQRPRRVPRRYAFGALGKLAGVAGVVLVGRTGSAQPPAASPTMVEVQTGVRVRGDTLDLVVRQPTLAGAVRADTLHVLFATDTVYALHDGTRTAVPPMMAAQLRTMRRIRLGEIDLERTGLLPPSKP